MFIVGTADGLLANTRKESEIKTEVKSRGNQSYLCHDLPLRHVQVRDLTFYGHEYLKDGPTLIHKRVHIVHTAAVLFEKRFVIKYESA